MKYINYLFIMVLFLSACQVSTLIDATGNEFTAQVTQGDYKDKIVISWIKRDFYANYTVLKSETKDGVYLPFKEFFSGESVEDTIIDEGQTYFYKVRGYNQLGTATFVTKPADGYAGSSGGFLPPDEITYIPGSSAKQIEFSWNKVEGAVEYEILRSTDNDFFEVIETTPRIEYQDRNVKRGRKYYYKITSLNKDGIRSQDSSETIVGELFDADLEFRSPVGEYTDRIQLIWKPYQYANEYTIFRSEKLGVYGEEIKKIIISDEVKLSGQDLEYNDKDVKPIIVYYYTIIYKNQEQGIPNITYVVRSYLKTENVPAQPTISVSEGSYPKDVLLSWNPVEGAKSYEIARAVSQNGPWRVLKTIAGTTYKDKNIPNDSYTYFYTVTGLNSNGTGAVSVAEKGWANKPPVGITTSKDFGEKVRLSWDKVPKAASYIVTFSETKTGVYRLADDSISRDEKEKVVFEHFPDSSIIGDGDSKKLWYKVAVKTKSGDTSIPSSAKQGKIQKIVAPTGLLIPENKTRTKSMQMSWNSVDGARGGYRIYRATLAHKNASADKLEPSHFKKIGESENNSFNLSFNTYPIRKYVYEVRAVDIEDAEGEGAKTETVWRLPVDARDFAKDVDFTMVQAQTQINNFGAQGSGGTIYGRAGGNYENYAGMSGAKNIWDDYISFEVTLDGAQDIGVDIGNLSATLNGPLNVTGLYKGTIIYNSLNAKEGGYVFAGSMTIKYEEETVEWNHTEAAAHLKSVVLLGSESPPGRPNFEAGHGL